MKKWVIYKVDQHHQDWRTNENAFIVEEFTDPIKCSYRCNRLNIDDKTAPFNPSGYRQSLHKYCSLDDWEEGRAKLMQLSMFGS